MKKPNPIPFYIGLILAVGAAIWTFIGPYNQSHTVLELIGIILIATSKYRLIR